MTPDAPLNHQGSLFDSQLPEHNEYPMNRGGETVVWNLVRNDIANSESYLIITGYSSLEYIIEQFGGPLSSRDCVDIVLGNEPVVWYGRQEKRGGSRIGCRSVAASANTSSYYPVTAPDSSSSLSHEIRDYWLERGISILLNGQVLNLIEKIKYGKVAFFSRSNLHAKLYRGDHYAMLGSSNFSRPGMQTQGEANIRRECGTEGYRDICDIATHFRESATLWNDAILKLLEQLLKVVSWQEALGRAIALINEGQWIEKYPDVWLQRRSASLWPTQKKSIAQALYLLERQGSVLIADPTGSGKTRMGARLLEALLNRLWLQSAQFRANYQIICPPLVIDTWEKELSHLQQSMADPVSHGLLSNPENDRSYEVIRKIRYAHILLVDEAHNYLNKASARSRSIVVNRADHVILFTATPLNRRSEDLLRLVEILGLDNLSDKAYKTYKELMSSRDARSPEKMDQLRTYVHRFMVRRTKSELNEAINEDPEAYRDEFGALCRYPVNRPKTYKTKETEDDIAIARQIEKRIARLKGIIYLANLKADAYDRFNEEREKAFLKKRLSMGPALTRYNIRNMLRSSRAALTEHLKGTAAAMEAFDINVFKKSETGNIIERVRRLQKVRPITNLSIPLPEWMNDTERWQQICEEEISLLEEIAGLVTQMSDCRETGKAEQVARLIESKNMLLVYDTALITLHLIHKKLDAMDYGKETMVVTGSTGTTKRLLTKSFALEAENGRMAALCSDALAEGVNLQRASAVLFLDMPSVIRVAEQRIGRVDRMDSPHKEVSVYWPDDSEAFRLKTDRNFYHRHQMVEDLIGSNIVLPEHLSLRSDETFAEETLSTDEVIAELEEHQKADRSWEGFEDAFSSMRNLVFGDKPLIDKAMYEAVVREGEGNRAWISVVRGKETFVFAAVRGSENTAPYWIFRDDGGGVQQDMNKIVKKLRGLLPEAESCQYDDKADALMKKQMAWLARHEQETLPNKKKNAIEQMQYLLPKWLKMEDKRSPQWWRYVRQLHDLVFQQKNRADSSGSMSRRSSRNDGYTGTGFGEGSGSANTSEEGVDWYELANRWLDVAQPELIRWLETERKNRKYQDIRLKNINSHLRKNPLDEVALAHILEGLPVLEPVDKRVVSMIIGVE